MNENEHIVIFLIFCQISTYKIQIYSQEHLKYIYKLSLNQYKMSLSHQPAHLTPVSQAKAQIFLSQKSKSNNKFTKFNQRQYSGSEDELDDLNQQIDQSSNNKSTFIEDSYKSHHSFQIYIYIEYSLLLLTFLSFLGSIIENDLLHGANKLELQVLLILQTINTIFLIILIILRYQTLLQLRQDQKIQNSSITILNISYLWQIGLEIFVILPHPTLLTFDSELYLFQPYDYVYVTHRTNDILSVIMLLRSYIIIRTIIMSTSYASTRTSRLCRIYGCQHNFMFAVKCLMQEKPLRTLGLLFIFLLLIYGHGLKMSQQSLIDQVVSSFDLSSYANCFWCVIITMGTIGYGEYYPRTYPGRSIIFLTAISGLILSSLLIFTLSAYLSLDLNQNKAHITLKRLKLRKLLENTALQAIKQTGKVSYSLKNNEGDIRNSFQNLKKKAYQSKMIMRKIQTIVDNDNVNQQMNRLFHILKVDLKQIYENQKETQENLVKLYKKQGRRLNKLKFCFTTEIESIIKQK